MRNLKKKEGITLIALVVTIIVLLILAGISISMLTGQNGVLNRAQEAKEKTEEAEKKEQNSLNSYEDVINIYTGNANEILEDKAESYGAIVTNYIAQEIQEKIEWKIFHSDGENVYLIASDYVSYSSVPNGKNGTPISVNSTDYSLSMNNVINDYNGIEDINKNIFTQKCLKQFFNRNDIADLTNNNIKATAYMLDTNIWNKYANQYADYAVGGPTIELFRDSYNEIHPQCRIETEASSNIGYMMKGGPNKIEDFQTYLEGLSTAEEEKLWINSDKDKALGMWIASPSNNNPITMINVNFSGAVSICNYDYEKMGFRPIIRLKKDTYLEKQDDGTYKIIN